MRDLAVLFLQLILTIVRLAGPDGTRSAVAESVLVRQQVLNPSRSSCVRQVLTSIPEVV